MNKMSGPFFALDVKKVNLWQVWFVWFANGKMLIDPTLRPYFTTHPTFKTHLKTHFLFGRSGFLCGFLRSGISQIPT